MVQVNTISHEVAYISQHKFSESFFSYAPGSEDIVLCYINKSVTSNPDSLSIYRLTNEAGFPEKWSSITTADSREIGYCDHDIYLGTGLYYYASEDVMVIACVLRKSINLYSCSTGALLASRDFSTRIKSAVQSDSRECLFLFMEDGLVDVLHLDTNLLQSEYQFFTMMHLGFNPTNVISFMGKTIVAEHNNNPVVCVFREKRDKNYRVIASKLRYLNNEYVKYFPEKEVLAIITNQNNEKCLVLIDKRSAQITNSIVLGEGSYTMEEGTILPDHKLLIKSSNPNNVWLVNLDKCRIELIEETTNKKGIIYKSENNVYIALVGDNNFELYSYFDGANHIKSWTCSNGVLPMPELLVANSNYIVLPTTTFPDYDTLAVSIFDYHGNQKTIKIYDLTDRDLLRNILAPKTKLSQKKSFFAFFDEHGRFCVVDLKDGETIISVKDPKRKMLGFAFIKKDS